MSVSFSARPRSLGGEPIWNAPRGIHWNANETSPTHGRGAHLGSTVFVAHHAETGQPDKESHGAPSARASRRTPSTAPEVTG
jgi:hypothetical protein